MPPQAPLNIGLTGLGGYAGAICDVLEQVAATPDASVRFVAVSEPDHKTHADKIAALRAKGIRVFERYDDLLAVPEIEAVWLPLPIDLHRPFTEKALAAGKAVMCEKPAAGCVDDIDAMIAARDRAKLPVGIAYQDVYDPTTVTLKRLLLDGAIGTITRASVIACWPRNDQYYARTAWAGRFKRNDTWVMDSPANNACAHYVNIPLFLMGPDIASAAQPVAVDAELYRVNPIENFDTISMRVHLDGGASLLVAMTHGCERLVQQEVVIHGTRGKITRTNECIVVESDGRTRTIERGGDARPRLLERFANAVRNKPDPDAAMATLESARPQLVAVNGASEASLIHDVAPAHYRSVDFHGGTLRAIDGIEDAFLACVRDDRMLHETGRVAWSKAAGSKDLHGYRHFAGPAVAAPAST